MFCFLVFHELINWKLQVVVFQTRMPLLGSLRLRWQLLQVDTVVECISLLKRCRLCMRSHTKLSLRPLYSSARRLISFRAFGFHLAGAILCHLYVNWNRILCLQVPRDDLPACGLTVSRNRPWISLQLDSTRFRAPIRRLCA